MPPSPDARPPAADGSAAATAGGLAALAIWSGSVAGVRGLGEALGTLTGSALAMAAGGAVGLAAAWVAGRSPASMLRLRPKYLLGCGSLFVTYIVFAFAAIGWAQNRATVLVVGLLNYLWPVLTVVFSVPILGRRARWPAVLGCALALAGTALAVLTDPQFRWAQLRRAGLPAAGPMLLATAAAVAWGLYANLVRRWGSPQAGAVPLFLLAAAAVLGVGRLFHTEATAWTPKAVGELCFVAIGQLALAYVLYERGMRRGNHLLLSLAGYFLPVAAISAAAAYLRVLPGAGLIAGCVLVTAGALVCKYSLVDPPARPPPLRG